MEIEKLKKIVSELCIETGKNIAHDYDGIDSEEDILIYLESILRFIKSKNLKLIDNTIRKRKILLDFENWHHKKHHYSYPFSEQDIEDYLKAN